MSTVELTRENFETTVKKDGIVLVDWWAAWCGPCRRFAPIYEAAAGKHEDIVFGKIDTEAQPELAAAFDIRSIPTLMIFRDGVPLFAQPGMLPPAALDDLIAQTRKLDMAEVRKKVAELENEQASKRPKQAAAG
jgi:thioredoxin 1